MVCCGRPAMAIRWQRAIFLLETGPSGEKHWVWIDMESGVPALFPLSPLALFRFYLPRALRYGRPMFDDIDIPRLEGLSRAAQGGAEGGSWCGRVG